ncbi:UbiA family prenyltransferase [Polynucleobacter paneuropaeus]|nr:UbiA family prenyltransferase [Polynucleobacter paneuropaeus]
MNNSIPLAVDLDGTLIQGDLFFESILSLIKQNPLHVFYIVVWIFGGIAYLKKRVALIADINLTLIQYNQDLIKFLLEKKKNTKLILCSGSDELFLNKINDHLKIFDEVIGSNGKINLTGINKAKYLIEKYGHKGYQYIGNSSIDFPVWRGAISGWVISDSEELIKRAKSINGLESLPFVKSSASSPVWKLIRPHQWLKNALIFIPLITAPNLPSLLDVGLLFLAFFSFSFCASSVYILNDLFDLESDRAHDIKRFRPLASGVISIPRSIGLSIILLLAATIIAFFINPEYFILMAGYFLLTLCYTLGIKKLVLTDCFTLGILYTLRIIVGAIVLTLQVSFWLLAFSFFLFLSLALIKRYSEIICTACKSSSSIPGRGYLIGDAPMIQVLGVATGCISGLVFALYINSERINLAFHRGEFLLGMVPLILFWISFMWLQASRGNMHIDPLVYAISNRTSQAVGIIGIVLVIAAKIA